MTGKEELVQLICQMGKDETPEYLTNFPEGELKEYYDHLKKQLDLRSSKSAQMACH